MRHNTLNNTLLLAGILGGLAAIPAYGQARNAYYTIQPNATNNGFVHTLSWVALDSQYSGSVYDNPVTTGVNEGARDKINRGTPFGSAGTEVHDVQTPQNNGSPLLVDFGEGPAEIRYRHGSNGAINPVANNGAGGYVYLGSEYATPGDIGPAISTPKWDDIGVYTSIPNGFRAGGFDGVTAIGSADPSGAGAVTSPHGLYDDTDSFTSPTDDLGIAFVGYADQQANGGTSEAPNTGYLQFEVPTATGKTAADYFIDDAGVGGNESTFGNAFGVGVFTEGVWTSNASIEVTVSTDSSYVPTLAVSGDFDGDQDVDNSDIIVGSGGFTGAAASGEFFGQYYRDGDVNGDGDVDNSDLAAIAGNFTGAAAGSLTDTAAPDLIYDPVTGNVTLDADGGNNITGFQLESAGGFTDANYNSQSGGGYGGLFEDVSDSVLGDSDLTFAGLASLDLGNVLASGLTLTELEALLSTADFGAGLGNSGEFDLVIAVVPEPSTTALLGLGAFGLLLRRRR